MDQRADADAPWTWLDERRFELRGSRFTSGTMPMGMGDDEFLIIKPPELTARYLELVRREAPRRIVELGVKAGGSTAMLALLAQPELLLAIELADEVPPLLARFIADHDLDARLQTAFGIDQGDRLAVTAAVDAARGGEPLDLVIDDASHILGPTRASLEVLFPRLRPGGLYVIEDWSSECTVARNLARALPDDTELAQRLDAVNQIFHILNAPDGQLPPSVVASMQAVAAGRPAPDGEPTGSLDLFDLLISAAAHADLSDLPAGPAGGVRPVADLAVELTMLAATAPEVVAELTIDGAWLTIRRGDADLPLDGFDLGGRWTDFFGYLPR